MSRWSKKQSKEVDKRKEEEGLVNLYNPSKGKERRILLLTIENSSSIAMTTSTASRESKPRSEVKDEEAES